MRLTIKQQCRGRLLAIPSRKEAAPAERIAVMAHNLKVMREEIGNVPLFYPQSDDQIEAWLERHDRTREHIDRAVRKLADLSG